eukprot:GFUD01023157.1.p1 GENE.GFUD01023157.1~~GFUD01023157.1.p1  ORF type:complete len:413 (-),score=90.64 GFUD01023157.1:217-1455(-)
MTQDSDPGRLVFLVFYYLGFSILFPYMMLLTVTDFWNYKFRDPNIPFNRTSDEFTDLQLKFPGYVSVAGNVPVAIIVILSAFLGWRVSLKMRMLASAWAMVIFFGGITLLAGLDTDQWQNSLFILILLLITLYRSLNAVFQATFFGNLGRFPSRYIGAGNDGIGLGSSLPPVITIIILLANPLPSTLGIATISFALVTMLLVIPLYHLILSKPFYIHHSGLNQMSRPLDFQQFSRVFVSCLPYLVSILLNYTISLSLHPAVTALVKPVTPQSSPWNDKYFVPVCSFLLAAVCDWLGKSVASLSQWPRPGRLTEVGVCLAVCARVAFIPAIMACNVAPSNRNTEVLLHADWMYICLLAVFSFTGGHLGNVGMMLGPKKVETESQELAGTLTIAALVIGLGVGSLLGPVLVSLL